MSYDRHGYALLLLIPPATALVCDGVISRMLDLVTLSLVFFIDRAT